MGHFTWDQVEQATNLTFNTVIFDCEGCYNSMVEEHKEKFNHIDKVIIEYDKPGAMSTDVAWVAMKGTIGLLRAAGLQISQDSKEGLDNLRLDETGDLTIPHTLACNYVFIRNKP